MCGLVLKKYVPIIFLKGNKAAELGVKSLIILKWTLKK
jgi:hypothetical protein